MSEPQPSEPPVADSEALVRILVWQKHIARRAHRVRWAAFLPNATGKTSVFRVDGLADADVDEIGRGVATARARPFYGYGRLLAAQATSAGLAAVSSTPPPRHADIIHWPELKSARQLAAQVLADGATLHLPADVEE